MKKYKRTFTLLEVLIALGLASLLMGALFFWFRFLTLSQNETKDVQWIILEERYCDQRLSRIFSNAKGKEKENEWFFFTSGSDLIFHFDNGPHLDPLFAGTVLGQLYLDKKNHCLCLCLWPHNKKSPYEHLPLLSEVSGFKIQFYEPPPSSSLIVDPEKIDATLPPRGWQDSWKSIFSEIPAFVKITVHRMASKNLPEREIEFIYELPSAQKMIAFSEKESIERKK